MAINHRQLTSQSVCDDSWGKVWNYFDQEGGYVLAPANKNVRVRVIITGRNSTDNASLANFSMAADTGDSNAAVLGFVLAVEGDDDAG